MKNEVRTIAFYFLFGITAILCVFALVFVFADTLPVGAPIDRGLTQQEFEAIKLKQESLLTKYGEYVQVTKDGRIVTRTGAKNEAELEAILPSNVEIIPFESDDGQGFKVFVTTDTSIFKTTVNPDGSIENEEIPLSSLPTI